MITQATPRQKPRHTIRQFNTVQKDVNNILRDFFAAQVSYAKPIGASYTTLWQAMGDLALAGGKRLRPYVAIAIYEAFGGKHYKDMLQVVVGLELLHLSLLIHDDIIDRDTMRYGRDNLIGTFRKKYIRLTKNTTDATHYAQAAALLAGDLLLAAAHQHIAQAQFAEDKKQAVLQALSTSMFEVVGGQLLDTEAALLPADKTNSLAVARYKTASYSFVLPLSAGATLAGTSDTTVAKLQLLGQNVGTAYQLVDDLLGLFGAKATIGKSTLSDLQEGKATYVLQAALSMATRADQAELIRMIGNPRVTKNDLMRMRHIVTACGAKHATEALVVRYQAKAQAILNTLDLYEQAHTALQEFIQKALQRSM